MCIFIFYFCTVLYLGSWYCLVLFCFSVLSLQNCLCFVSTVNKLFFWLSCSYQIRKDASLHMYTCRHDLVDSIVFQHSFSGGSSIFSHLHIEQMILKLQNAHAWRLILIRPPHLLIYLHRFQAGIPRTKAMLPVGLSSNPVWAGTHIPEYYIALQKQEWMYSDSDKQSNYTRTQRKCCFHVDCQMTCWQSQRSCTEAVQLSFLFLLRKKLEPQIDRYVGKEAEWKRCSHVFTF